MEIQFLGTSGMQPSKERNHPSVLISHKNENILVDCGEGTQRQFLKADISPTKLTKILISHWHSDHVLGLPGLLITLASLEYSKTLEVYGPKGTKKFFDRLFNLFINKNDIKVVIHELNNEGIFLETKDLIFSSVKLDHTAPCLGYIIKEKDTRKMNLTYLKKFGLTKDPLLGKLQSGKNITYKGKKILVKNATKLIPGKKISVIMDTSYNKKISKAVLNSDILIIEATLDSKLDERSKIVKHLTSNQAAKIAKDAKVKKLVLTHFSRRYKNPNKIYKEAKKIFKNTFIAEDFMKV